MARIDLTEINELHRQLSTTTAMDDDYVMETARGDRKLPWPLVLIGLMVAAIIIGIAVVKNGQDR